MRVRGQLTCDGGIKGYCAPFTSAFHGLPRSNLNFALYTGEDKKRRESVDTKNQAESMIYQTEKQLKEFEAKVPVDVKVSIMGQGNTLISGRS